MNVFEDLIEELKEENLLEDTVIDTLSSVDERPCEPAGTVRVGGGSFPSVGIKTSPAVANTELPIPAGRDQAWKKIVQTRTEEVDALQVAAHVISSIEMQRGSAKAQGSTFDDLRLKTSLHRFKNASTDASAELATLDAEISAWRASLARRDNSISTAWLRRYCESCQPALSPRALFALARFYRSIPFSEKVRGKFDFVVTRIFSRSEEPGQRQLICPRSEVVTHLRSRYADWSGEVLDPKHVDHPDIVLLVLGLDDLVAEAERAATFEELLASDFFKRVYLLKESIGPHFFEASVTAAAIDSNIRIGNRFTHLLKNERKKIDVMKLREKYGFSSDETISDASARSFELEDLLFELKSGREQAAVTVSTNAGDGELFEQQKRSSLRGPSGELDSKRSIRSIGSGLFDLNRRLVAICVLGLILSAGLYLGTEYFVGEQPVSADVKVFDLENSSFKEFVKTGRISGETLYGVTQPAWDALAKDQQEAVLKKIIQDGASKGFNKVSLINGRGKTVGFASPQRIEVIIPTP
jgi:hypothetical protein